MSLPNRTTQIGTARPGVWSVRSGTTSISSAASIVSKSASLQPLMMFASSLPDPNDTVGSLKPLHLSPSTRWETLRQELLA